MFNAWRREVPENTKKICHIIAKEFMKNIDNEEYFFTIIKDKVIN